MKDITLILLLLILTSCASYSRKEFKNELVKIENSDYSGLSGKYESKPFHYFGKQSD